MEEAAAAIEAIAREAASQLCAGLLNSVPAMATFSTIQALGPLRPLLFPQPTVVELISRYLILIFWALLNLLSF